MSPETTSRATASAATTSTASSLDGQQRHLARVHAQIDALQNHAAAAGDG